MKTKTTMLLALLLALVCTAASAQEYYTLPEIREQAAQGWHETYTDKYGRTRQVDIDIEVFGEERAPVIKACWDDPYALLFQGEKDPYGEITEEVDKGRIQEEIQLCNFRKNVVSPCSWQVVRAAV